MCRVGLITSLTVLPGDEALGSGAAAEKLAEFVSFTQTPQHNPREGHDMSTKLAAPTVLKTILTARRKKWRSGKAVPISELELAAQSADPVRGFRQALADRVARDEAAVIAEVKRASPSKASSP